MSGRLLNKSSTSRLGGIVQQNFYHDVLDDFMNHMVQAEAIRI